ncbi:hypothetical protein PCIT_a0092 [Pseudoalteromonas citrea]|uniref:Uncharacterized protein n=1 Tax=Pseudoalteromonas citrea TaxID=43655 RepID=A0AAD4AK25_9GAMM|nr:hypothetical protein PCIT_a0092 [Pseudoalteromonas citrea]
MNTIDSPYTRGAGVNFLNDAFHTLYFEKITYAYWFFAH